MRALLLYNPTAGRVPVRYFVKDAASRLRHMGWQVEIQPSKSAENVTEIAKQAAEDGLEVVFVIGGDGTIRRAASGLAGSQTVLGILPAGTMNVFALEMGLRHFTWHRLWALSSNVSKLAASRFYQVDLGRCGKDHFMLWVGIGLDALTVQQIEPRPRFDKFVTIPHYAAQAVWNATQWHGQELVFRTNGQEIAGRYILAVVANIRKYMGGLVTISPEARLDDGEMDLWLFSGAHIGDTARHVVDIATQRHAQSLNVQRVPFRSLEVESDKTFGVQMDGDPEPGFKRVDVEVLPRALNLLLPDRSPALRQVAQSGTPLLEQSHSIVGHRSP